MSTVDAGRRRLLVGLVAAMPSVSAASPGAPTPSRRRGSDVDRLVRVARERVRRVTEHAERAASHAPRHRGLAEHLGDVGAAIAGLDAVARLPLEAQGLPVVQDLLLELASRMGRAAAGLEPSILQLAGMSEAKADLALLAAMERGADELPSPRARARATGALRRFRRQLDSQPLAELAGSSLSTLHDHHDLAARLSDPLAGPAAARDRFGAGYDDAAARLLAGEGGEDEPGATDPDLRDELLRTPRQQRIASRVTLVGGLLLGLSVVGGALCFAGAAAEMSTCWCGAVLILLAGAMFLGIIAPVAGMFARARHLALGDVPDPYVQARLPLSEGPGWRPSGVTVDAEHEYWAEVAVATGRRWRLVSAAGHAGRPAPVGAPDPGEPEGAVLLRSGGAVVRVSPGWHTLAPGGLEYTVNGALGEPGAVLFVYAKSRGGG